MKQMYKVFFNERLIRISAEKKSYKNQPYIKFDLSSTISDIIKWFGTFKDNDVKDILLVHPEPEKFFGLFRSAFKELPAAGGVVCTGKMILFIFRNGKWDLPKGKIDRGEKPDQTAIREVMEECGITGHKIVKQLPSTFHIYLSGDHNNKWIFKETFWYEMHYAGEFAGVPQNSEGITEVRWMPEDKLGEVFDNTYENLKLLLTNMKNHCLI